MSKEGDGFLLILVLLVVVFVVIMSATGETEISSFGNIVSRQSGGGGDGDGFKIGFFSDAETTTPLTQVNWGEMQPATFSEVDLYIKNLSDRPLSLSLSTEKWDPPEAEDFMSLTWDYSGSIEAGKIKKTTLSLFVAQNVTGFTDFSFDIIVSYSEGLF